MIDIFSRSRHKAQDREGGFTLIELLVVIIILGVLSAVVVFAVTGVGDKGKNAAQKTDLKTLQTAEEGYCAKFGRYGTEAELVSAQFLSEASTQSDVILNSGGNCGAKSSSTSQYLLTVQNPTEDSLTVGVNPQSSAADFTGGFTGSPAGVKNNFGMGPTNTNMFENLVRMTPDFHYEPWLAESWDLPGAVPAGGGPALGPTTYRFHLRHGVLFHNGTELKADSVIYTFNNRIAPSTSLGVTSTSAAVVAGDAYAVDVTLSFANARFLEQLVHHQTGAIVALNTVPRSGAAATPTPVGTGPFKFSSYSQGNQLVLTRNDAYWGDKAKLKTLTFKFIADSNTRLLALQSGQIDMMFDVPKDSLAAVAATSGLKTAVSPPGFNEAIWFNSHRLPSAGTSNDAMSDLTVSTPPLTNGNRVRKAVAAAIDRSSILNATYPAGAVTANTFVPAAMLAPYDTMVSGPKFDPAEANTQLNAAGWTCTGTCGPGNLRSKGGVTLTLQLLNGYTPTSLRGDSDILVENSLKAVGIDVARTRLTDVQQSTYDAAMTNGTFDLYMERISQNDANPASPPSNFFDCAGGSGGTSAPAGTGVGAGGVCPNSGLNAIGAGYANWTADNVTPFAATLAAARLATDPEVAKQKTAEAMHYAVDDYVVGVHLGALNSLFGMKSDVQGFLLHGSLRQVRWASVYRLG